MLRVMMLIPMAAALLACGLVARGHDPVADVSEDSAAPIEKFPSQLDESLPPPTGAVPSTAPVEKLPVQLDESLPPPTGAVPSTAPVEKLPVQLDEPLPPPTGTAPSITGDSFTSLYAGDSLIEEKVINSTTVVRATMASFSSEVIAEPNNKYAVALKFNLAVSEYLKGTGPSSIVAVWVDGRSYDTRGKANSRRDVILAERDTQWDDRKAIIFLYGPGSGFGASLDAQLQLADHFLLYVGDPYSPDDFYSLHSKSNKRWLPAASSTSSTGDSQEFLLDVPPPMETFTLSELKRRIAELSTELNGGGGSERYRECVLEKYQYIRNQRNWPDERGYTYGAWDLYYSVASAQPAGTVLDWRHLHGDDPITDYESPIQFEGRDAALFDTAVTESTILEMAGEYVETKYVEIVRLARPLPAGEYRVDLKESWPRYAVCDFVISNELVVTVVAPEGVLHEALFDPVADGSAVAADSTNGVLDPASFTDAGSATTTIDRIEWEAGTARLKLTPHNALAGRVMDFIELDGTVSLSLTIDDATVDTANNTLSWSVSPQPWDDGDKLMLRIR